MASEPSTGAGAFRTSRGPPSGIDGLPAQGLSRTAPSSVTVEQYIHLMLGRDPWQPHPLNPEEIRSIRQQCYKLVLTNYIHRRAHVRKLTQRQPVGTAEEREKLALEVRRHESEALKTFIAYRLIFWRIFRIHDLPMEILSTIIRFVVWSAPSHTNWHSLEATTHLGIELPSTCCHLRFNSMECDLRSRTSPLDLRIDDGPTRRFTDQEVCALLKALTPHLHHIRILIIILEDWEPILSVLKSPYLWPGLAWRGTKFNPVNHSVSLYSLFGGKYVPELKSLTINSVNIDWVNTPSLNNLQTLDLRRIPLELCPTLSRFQQILASSPMLTNLSLDGAGPASDPTVVVNDYHAIDLPHLHTLVLANFAAPFTKYLVSHFTAPNLKDLTILNFEGSDYGPFYEFMIGRFQKIKLLTLRKINCPVDTLPVMIQWLDSMPLLTYARLAALEHDILQAFLFDPDTMKAHPDLSPSLRSAFRIVEDSSGTGLTAPSKEALEDVERKPRIVSPCLNILEVETTRPDVFADFVLARKLCGVSVKKTYMDRSMAKTFTGAALKDISQHIHTLVCVDIGAKTQEVNELLNVP
ncbi:hypothetical protein FB446DRAFT_794200 [Lentinula raphanica]|nr:hypothetical protein EV360DRAFT_89346 [Lentinula raphanica]KAJ3766338.1 hypothetical protein FB446DRAFT_794200 [Lentinula raphanica]